MTFDEKIELADAMQSGDHLFRITKIDGDTVHFEDHLCTYTMCKEKLEKLNVKLFIELTDKEAA